MINPELRTLMKCRDIDLELYLVLSLDKVINVASHVVETAIRLLVFAKVGEEVRVADLRLDLPKRI